MKKKDNNIKAFFALLQAGLWGHVSDNLNPDYKYVEWDEVYRMAEEQSVVGLIAAGIDYLKENEPGFAVPQTIALQFIGATLQIEQQNTAMNVFVAELIQKMRDAGIYALLMKGQGIAQCYDRPLWRSSGDVDLFLSDDNYEKTKSFLLSLSSSVEPEGKRSKHLSMIVDGWVVELHGRLYGGLSNRIDHELDGVQKDTFYSGSVRSWDNGKVQVFQLSPENDAFYVLTHILQHFYKGGIGLRQICDWSRLLWKYRSDLNLAVLVKRLRKAGMMCAWKAFGSFAANYLGMPSEAMPFYSEKACYRRKAAKIQKFILKVGNFGHNRDMSFYSTKPYLVRKIMSLGRRMGDLMNHFFIFPVDTMRFLPNIMINGLKSAANGE